MPSLLFHSILCFFFLYFMGTFAQANGCNIPCGNGGNKSLICYQLLFFSWNACEVDNNTLRGLIPSKCGCCDSNDDDGDGICNELDVCPGFDDLQDENGNGIPDDCEEDEVMVVASVPTNPPSSHIPSHIPSHSPTITPPSPSMAPILTPSQFPTMIPTTPFPTTTTTKGTSPCAVAVSMQCRTTATGAPCDAIAPRTQNCLVTISYDLHICNRYDDPLDITGANLLLNGQSFDIRMQLEFLVVSPQQCQSLAPRVEIDVCGSVSLLAELIVAVDDCGDSDSVYLSL